MKLNEIQHNEISLKNVASDIVNQCSLYFSQDNPIYRATDGRPEVYKSNIRQDRYPKDSTAFSNILFNEAFEETFGVKYVRYKSLFTHTNINTLKSKEYSYDYYYVFPSNNCYLFYAEGIEDSLDILDGVGVKIRKYMKKNNVLENRYLNSYLKLLSNITLYTPLADLMDEFKKINPYLYEAVQEEYNTMKNEIKSYKKSTTIPSIKSNTEIMVIGDFYYGTQIPTSSTIHSEKDFRQMKKRIQQFAKHES